MNEINTTNETNNKNGLLPDDSFLNSLPSYNPGLVAIVQSPDMKILFVNHTFEYYLGYSNADVSGEGLSFRDLLEDYQYDHLLNQFNNVRESITARSAFVIYLLKNKNNTSTPFYLYASPITDSNITYGELYYVLMHPDLSTWGVPFTSFDSKDLFMEQFKSEYFGTFEWMIDVDKIFCSPGVYQIYEIDPQKRKINNFFIKDFIHPDDKIRVREATKRALKTGTDLNIEFRLITDKQHIKTVQCLARVIKNNQGKAVKFSGSIKDITNLKKEEAEKQHHEKLAVTGRLLRSLAHEIRNPLNNITLSIEQMQEDIQEETQRIYLNIIQRNSKRISDLISELLNTSHPAENVLQKQILQNILDDVIDASLDRQILKHIKLQLNYPDIPLEILADKEKLKIALLNIVINAVEAMEEQAGRLSVSLQRINNEAKLTISDNGCGISEENISHLFEPYFTQKRNGIGLGLTFTVNILQSHNAKIAVSSQPGIGTTFTINFPIVL